MNREQVIELMREVGAGHEHPMPNDYAGVVDVFVKFSDLVAAAEREACTQACADQAKRWKDNKGLYVAYECAAAIRARNTNKETK
jgi:hypothetical protein